MRLTLERFIAENRDAQVFAALKSNHSISKGEQFREAYQKWLLENVFTDGKTTLTEQDYDEIIKRMQHE